LKNCRPIFHPSSYLVGLISQKCKSLWLLTDTQACYGVQKHPTSTFQSIKRIYTALI
jgi:hypothetical protein